MKKYKAICFDVDGTLYPVEDLNEMVKRVKSRLGKQAEYYQNGRDYLRTIQDTEERKNIPGCETFYGLEVYSFKHQYPTEISLAQAKEILDEYYKILRDEYKGLKPQKVVRETLLSIKKAGLKIGVFSDWPLYEKLEIINVADIPDCSFGSYDSLCVKPSARAFDPMINSLGIKPSDILYVGDNYNRDCLGALKAGMDSVLVNVENDREYPGCLCHFCNFEDFSNWILKQL